MKMKKTTWWGQFHKRTGVLKEVARKRSDFDAFTCTEKKCSYGCESMRFARIEIKEVSKK